MDAYGRFQADFYIGSTLCCQRHQPQLKSDGNHRCKSTVKTKVCPHFERLTLFCIAQEKILKR